MTQAYSDPKRANDQYALPDVEVFYVTAKHAARNREDDGPDGDVLGNGMTEPGWYWWTCLPGCLPDSEACGPFNTEAEALADAQSAYDWDDSEAAP